MSEAEFVALILEKNGSDIQAIITKLGLSNCIAVLPNLMSIFATVQAAQAAQAEKAKAS